MKKNSFLNCFPMPSFLRMSSVGLDISDGFVRFVELLNNGEKKYLGKFGKREIPKDVIFEGQIKNRPALIKILKSLKKEYGFNFIRTSIIEKNSYIFKTFIPKKDNMSYEEICGSLSFKLEENVPIKPEDAIFDFEVLREDKKNLYLVVSVLSKEVVDQFISIFEESGLVPLSLEVEVQAIARSVISVEDNDTFMVVDFGNTRVSIFIVSNKIVQFTATIDMGGEDLNFAIKKSLNVSLEKADKIKREKGFVKDDSGSDLFYVMMNTVAALKDEMNKYLIYWHNHKDDIKENKRQTVKKIILCGENSYLKGLDDYLSLSLGLQVEKARVWTNIFSFDDFVPDMNFNESLGYSATIGLAMREGDNYIQDLLK